ncbi:stAR-related lipid transfer protein 3-like isoform X3 [Saccostrea echinata]|uniref:stAR-related lipid transfer protein 3-like isoform X3 n=1 Tax=Saccostrea echinata TaxID=191078 RepID=UPI002A8210B6|nr:stAR-related lipid transfer protein 3-like isoform X3 [Saccostrea echinata]
MPIMSVNAATNDMVSVSGAREQKARQAGTAIYGSVHNQNMTSRVEDDHDTYVYGPERISTHPYSHCSTISSVRRTFCLIALFDLCFCFILWVIYTQLTGSETVWEAFEQQVANYNFKTSLFDTVMVAALRFVLIELGYALFRLNHWWLIAISTSLTCIFLIAKVFLFEFSHAGKPENPLSYILLLASFILTWIETWFLDFKVLPTEKKILLKGTHGQPNERSSLLRHAEEGNSIPDDDKDTRYYSPAGSDDESDMDRYRSVPSTRSHSRKDLEYLKIAKGAMDMLWELVREEGWTIEKEREEDVVRSAYIKKLKRKIYKLECILDISPKELWLDTIENINESPSWNPTLLEARTLQVVDDRTDISYNIAAEAAGGLVSARDFINLRHWGEKDQTLFIAVDGATFPDMPPQKKYVRGVSGPGGMVFHRIEGQPNKCRLDWYLNTNLKGWIPQAAIDQGLTSVLMDYSKYLRLHILEIKTRNIS